MNPKVIEVIDRIRNMDLSNYPYQEVMKLLRQLPKFGGVMQNLHPGKTVLRVRPNYGHEQFLSKNELSYKPSIHNLNYQRASTPKMTMFYGTFLPDNINPGDLDNERVIGVSEILPWLRDKTKKGIQKVTFSRWLVKKDIKLAAIVQHKDFYSKSSYTAELTDSFNKFIEMYPEIKDETIFITDFFAKEFAKENIENDSDYIISAALTEFFINRGVNGVFYPSVRVGGQGFNVAIHPDIVDSSMELIAAGECLIYKNHDHTIVDNLTEAVVIPNNPILTYKETNPLYHAGESECLRRLGLHSISQLLE